ncbi:hypothetical protein GY12_01495 [Micrococcus luteus]|nr:hypothetical protein GY12_01495 [Micrococcus luteus]
MFRGHGLILAPGPDTIRSAIARIARAPPSSGSQRARRRSTRPAGVRGRGLPLVLDGGPRGQVRGQRAVGPDHPPPGRAGARFGHRPAGLPRAADPQQAGQPPVADGSSGRDQTGERLEPLAEGERSVVAVAGAGELRVIGHDPILSCPPVRVA